MATKVFNSYLNQNNLDIKPVQSDQVTKTAEEAAQVHGVPVSNIVKSLVVKVGEEFVIVLCPGDRKVDFTELKEILGKKDVQVKMADPDEVKEVTGHSIGGVPPFGHKQKLKTVILDGFDSEQPLWAAAGAADVNFETRLQQLRDIISQ